MCVSLSRFSERQSAAAAVVLLLPSHSMCVRVLATRDRSKHAAQVGSRGGKGNGETVAVHGSPQDEQAERAAAAQPAGFDGPPQYLRPLPRTVGYYYHPQPLEAVSPSLLCLSL